MDRLSRFDKFERLSSVLIVLLMGFTVGWLARTAYTYTKPSECSCVLGQHDDPADCAIHGVEEE